MKDRKGAREPQITPKENLPAIEVENILKPIGCPQFENPLTEQINHKIDWVWQCNGSAQTLIVAIDELMSVLGTHERIEP
jgi:hypothetical protein